MGITNVVSCTFAAHAQVTVYHCLVKDMFMCEEDFLKYLIAIILL